MKLYNGNPTLGILDFDGNILNTDTPVYLKNKHTGEIEKFLAHETDQDYEKFYGENSLYEIVPETYCESRDFFLKNYHRGFGGLLEDVIDAIDNNNFAPSFESFKDVYLKKARAFAILTARGNSPDNFHKVFTLINEKTFTQEEKAEQYKNIIENYKLPKDTSYNEALYFYLGNVINYIPCSNLQIEKLLHFSGLSSAEKKAKAMDFLIPYSVELMESIYHKKIHKMIDENHALSIGFSDDSIKNIVAVFKKFQKILEKNTYAPKVPKRFSVYYTGPLKHKKSLLKQLGDEKKYKIKEKDFGLKIKLISS